ncbi:unnamed protein product, partial [Symbiodinium pilosum]
AQVNYVLVPSDPCLAPPPAVVQPVVLPLVAGTCETDPAQPLIIDACETRSLTCNKGPPFSLGTTAVSCITPLPDGDETQVNLDVVVSDTEAPVIDDKCQEVTKHIKVCQRQPLSFDVPAVTDNCPGAGEAVCSPAPGSVFRLGRTEVKCTATDASGNVAQSNFSVNTVCEGVQPPRRRIRRNF